MFDKLTSKFGKKANGDASKEAEESSASGTEKANKGSMIIRVIIIIGLAYVAVDHFILKEEEKSPVVAVKPIRKRKNPKKDAVTTPAPNPAPIAVTTPPPSTTTPSAPVPPAEIEAATTSPPSSPPVESVTITPKEELSIPAPAPKVQVGEVKSVEKNLDKQLDQLIESDNQKGGEVATQVKDKSIDLKDKIVVEEVYVPPPGYEVGGRGLVYNCKDKFWACVDKTSYVTCNKNMKYNKSQNKSAECVIENVYATIEDCGLIQKFKVSNALIPEDCK